MLTSAQTELLISQSGAVTSTTKRSQMRGELVIVIFFVVAIVLVSGFLAVALMFPELLPWYSGPSQRSSPPAATFWEESVA